MLVRPLVECKLMENLLYWFCLFVFLPFVEANVYQPFVCLSTECILLCLRCQTNFLMAPQMRPNGTTGCCATLVKKSKFFYTTLHWTDNLFCKKINLLAAKRLNWRPHKDPGVTTPPYIITLTHQGKWKHWALSQQKGMWCCVRPYSFWQRMKAFCPP